jgi:hypothetical protein
MARGGVLGAGFAPRYVAETTTKAQNLAGVFVQQGINTGSAAKTLADLTGTGTGQLLIQGTGSKTLADLTGTGTGALLIRGTSSKTLGDLTAAETGQLLIRGTASKALDDLTGTGAGQLLIQGAGAATLDDLTGTGTGTLLIRGTGAATLDGLTGSGGATLSAAAELADLVRRAKGITGSATRRRRRRREIDIIGRLRVRRPRIVAIGEASAPPEGELRGSIAIPLQLHGRGVVGAAGRGVLTLPAPALVARLFVAPCGDARLVLAPAVRATARHDHFTEEEIEQALAVLLAA